MVTIRIPRAAAALACSLLLTACAPGGDRETGPPRARTPPLPSEGLVIQVEHTGGFVTPELLAARLPLVSVYADGRVIAQDPHPEVHPPPAVPDLRVQHVDEDAVPVLVGHALDSGAGESADLGRPPVADVPSTRFTVVTRDETFVREVYALGAELPPGPGAPGTGQEGSRPPGGGPVTGLTDEQETARAELQDLVRTLADPAAVLPADAVGTSEPYVPEAVAGVVTAWTGRQDGIEHRTVPWPGPPLPGDPLNERLGLSCVLSAGEQARAVLEAARSATALTPWVSEDGRRWSIILRPLLPHEEACADLQAG